MIVVCRKLPQLFIVKPLFQAAAGSRRRAWQRSLAGNRKTSQSQSHPMAAQPLALAQIAATRMRNSGRSGKVQQFAHSPNKPRSRQSTQTR